MKCFSRTAILAALCGDFSSVDLTLNSIVVERSGISSGFWLAWPFSKINFRTAATVGNFKFSSDLRSMYFSMLKFYLKTDTILIDQFLFCSEKKKKMWKGLPNIEIESLRKFRVICCLNQFHLLRSLWLFHLEVYFHFLAWLALLAVELHFLELLSLEFLRYLPQLNHVSHLKRLVVNCLALDWWLYFHRHFLAVAYSLFVVYYLLLYQRFLHPRL